MSPGGWGDGLQLVAWRRTFRTPLAFGRHRLAARSGWWIVLRLANDVWGAGDCAPLPGFCPGTRQQALNALRAHPRTTPARLREVGARLDALARSTITGDVFADAFADALAPWPLAGSHAARSAVAFAAWDAVAQARGVEPATLLAPQARAQVASNQLVGAQGSGTLRAALVAAQGPARVVKIKSTGTPDAAWCQALDDALAADPALRVRIDANRTWGAEADALRALDALARLRASDRIEYVEEPLTRPSPARWARLLARTPLRLGLDESIVGASTPSSVLGLGAGARMALVLKPAVVGGPVATWRWANAATDAGARVTVTSFLDSEVGVAGAAQVACAIDARAAVSGVSDGCHGLGTLALFDDDAFATDGIRGDRIDAGRLRAAARTRVVDATWGGTPPTRTDASPSAGAVASPALPLDPAATDWLAVHASRMPGAVAIDVVDADVRMRVTWRELDALATKLCAAWGPGAPRVALEPLPAHEVMAAVGALWRSDAALVGINPRRDEMATRDGEERAGVTHRLHPGARVEVTAPDAARRAARRGERRTRGGASNPHADLAQADTWALLEADRPRRGSAEGPALVLFSSGTTGWPKAIALSRRALAASAALHRMHALEGEPGERGASVGTWLLCMPAWHVGGLSVLTRSILQGTPVRALARFDVDAVRDELARGDVAVISLVPTMLHRLVTAGVAAPRSMRLALIGGAPADPALLEAARALGWPVAPTWGMTECASQIATLRPDAPIEVTEGAIWLDLLPGVDVTCREDAGELHVRSPARLSGYLEAGRVVGPRSVMVNGRLSTGDIGRVRMGPESAQVAVLARRTDLILSGGENVYPAEVELRLQRHPGVLDVAVVGVPDPEWGQRVAAMLVLAEGVTLEVVRAWARRELPTMLRPVRWVARDALPRTPSGKVVRSEVLAACSTGG